jgi:hypothetical protein
MELKLVVTVAGGLGSKPVFAVAGGLDIVSNGSQETEKEAVPSVNFLGELMVNPIYFRALIGIVCLVDEPMALWRNLVAEPIDPREGSNPGRIRQQFPADLPR